MMARSSRRREWGLSWGRLREYCSEDRVVRDHSGKKDMLLFLVFCVLFMLQSESNTHVREKSRSLDDYVVHVYVCECMHKEHKFWSQNLWVDRGADY